MRLTVFSKFHFSVLIYSSATASRAYYYFYIMKRCQSYSNELKQAAVRVVLESAEWKEVCEGKRQRLTSRTLDLASVVANGASHDSINRWIKSDISLEAEIERLSHRGRSTEIPNDVRALCAGYAINRRLNLRPFLAKTSSILLGVFAIFLYPLNMFLI